MSAGKTEQETRIRLSPAVSVAVAENGVHLPPCDNRTLLELGLAGLLMLQEMAADEASSREDLIARTREMTGEPADPEVLRELLQTLEAYGLVFSHDAPRITASAASDVPRDSRQSPGVQDEPLVVAAPILLLVGAKGFELLDHDGQLTLRLSAREVMALGSFRTPRRWQEALALHREDCGEQALDEVRFRALIGHLFRHGMLVRTDDPRYQPRTMGASRSIPEFRADLARAVDRELAAVEREEHERLQQGCSPRVRVIPVMHQKWSTPLALGMILSAAHVFEGGRLKEDYCFLPDWNPSRESLEAHARQGGIFLFSNYIWSSAPHLRWSRRIKRINPDCVTVHGGPDVPKYQGDVEAYFRDHPYVDVLIHGEGEETACQMFAALAGHVGKGAPDLSPLRHVPGLSFREDGQVTRTAPRAQITKLDSVPSPFMSGIFDAYDGIEPPYVVLETNRGCPYGCTFCDWGSATLSKVRKFSLERVFAEMEWCARNRVSSIGLADANFGMLERDVLIAEKAAELKRKYGYPRAFGTNFAKNKIKYLQQIVEILVDEGIITEGMLSLQSMDPHTLDVIDRSNIKTEKYDELASQFRKAGLPLFVDLMLGLPGATTRSFREDLQQCVDRDVVAKIYQTEVLVNSPMNAPSYLERYAIKTEPIGATAMRSANNPESHRRPRAGDRRVVVQTSTFSRQDYDEMLDMRRAFVLFENLGVLRQVSRFVRHETGTREVDFVNDMRRLAREAPAEWPWLAYTLRVVPEVMAPPASWRMLIDEVGKILRRHYGLDDDTALRTVLQVQHLLLPAREREFPQRHALAHDLGAWHRQILAAKEAGHRHDWEKVVPSLREFGPAEFEISDPQRICMLAMGYAMHGTLDFLAVWELQSPVARAMGLRHLEYAQSV